MQNTFEHKIHKHVERLKKKPFHTLESEVAQKRITWCRQHLPPPHAKKSVSPRMAYEHFFFTYLGLTEVEVPVISETATEIIWSSRNKCPTLEACQILGLDTRDVCRSVYEKSTQVFLSQLAPQLRFYRSYQEIRPHSFHCKEMIIRVNFEQMMQLAIEEALIAKKEGNRGYGAVVTFENTIIGKAHDTVMTQNDSGLHAPVNAIRQAVKKLGNRNLCGAILFSTCEPCAMCTALAVWANVTTIVYGLPLEKIAQTSTPQIHISSQEIIDKSSVMVEVIGNTLKNECQTLLEVER